DGRGGPAAQAPGSPHHELPEGRRALSARPGGPPVAAVRPLGTDRAASGRGVSRSPAEGVWAAAVCAGTHWFLCQEAVTRHGGISGASLRRGRETQREP